MRLAAWSVLVVAAACGGSSTTTPPANRPGPAPAPVVHVGQPTRVQPYDKDAIKRTIEAQRDPIRACYERALQTQPGLTGKVVASFVIGLDGKVVQSTATGIDPGVATCIAGAIQAMTFPKPDGGVVSVNYPFELAP